MSEQKQYTSSDYKLAFTLKQHTPIIHFQSDQSGATLRATELKPKLDRFLIEKLELHDEHGKPKEEYKSWFIAGQDRALDYKVRVEPNNDSADDNDKNLKNYFGNQGHSVKKYPKLHSRTLAVEIKSFNSDLLKNIEENFASFLAVTNFGTRQTKGYGSFYLDDKSVGYKPIEDVLPTNTYYLEVDKKVDVDEVIKYFWSRLKSGINSNFSSLKSNQSFRDRGKNCKKGYQKAFIAKQIANWDKPWIKQVFFAGITADDYVFARALLGLSTRFSYKRTNEPCKPGDEHLMIEDDYIIDVYHKDIGRIKSPLIFKPIKGEMLRIYLIADDRHIQQLLTKQNKPFVFVKKFDFIKAIFLDRNNKFKTKKLAFPLFDIQKQEYYSLPNEITVTENNGDFEEFSYKKQYKRFKRFLDDYCEEKDGNYKAKVFTLPLPTSFDFKTILQDFIDDELKNSFSVQYRLKDNEQNFSVCLKRIPNAAN